MYNLLIAIAAAIAAALLFGFALGGGGFSIVYGLLPALLALGIVYVVLARRSFKQVQAINERAQEVLAKQRFEDAVDILKEAYPIGKWQFLVSPMISAQIGQILFMTRKFKDAEPFLKKAFKKNWTARAMLGVHYYKNGKTDLMKEVFEDAVAQNKKESLLWNIYAYCLWKNGDTEQAVRVLNRALEHVGGDDRTQANLKALQNNKKMKMRGWDMLWYQFHLDSPPAQRMQPQAQGRFRRR